MDTFRERSAARTWALTFGLAYLSIAIIETVVVSPPDWSMVAMHMHHHAVYAGMVAVAAGIFWATVARDIRRYGVPPRLRGLGRGLHRSARP